MSIFRKNICLSVFVFMFSVTTVVLIPAEERDYRESMRAFVCGISVYAKSRGPGFIIIPQNGQDLVTLDGEHDGPPAMAYLDAVDGTGREDLFYGYSRDNRRTRKRDEAFLLGFCRIFHNFGKAVLVTDYCRDRDKMDDAVSLNRAEGFLSFPAPDRDLNLIPSYPVPLVGENSRDIKTLNEAANFLYLIDTEKYATRQDMIRDLSATNYDAFIMDLFHQEEALTVSELDLIRYKKNGGRRLLICYMSIGEAEDYRFYWQPRWDRNPPSWLEEENPEWEGNYKVRYWDPDWQAVIFGGNEAYLDRIMDAGFDGVYLDIIDGFEYFEDR